jgi:hypothetical protein
MKISSESQKQVRENKIIRQYCISDDLATYDPYDIWKEGIGAKVKNLFNTSRFLGALPALILNLYDLLVNNRLRLGYNKQEYPIVRALAAQILDRQYQVTGEEICLTYANKHIDWLLKNYLKANHGIGWGANFVLPVTRNVVYSKTTPFSTITPYVLEALILHEKVTNQKGLYQDVCRSIYQFFDKDIQVLEQNAEFEVTSYGPFKDRKVVNSVSYTMYSLTLLDEYFNLSLNTLQRATRLYNYIKIQQQQDGSWYYSEEGKSFIDCFHSCIIIKNLIKTKTLGLNLEGIESVINKGYSYLKSNLWNEEKRIYKRFALKNKPGLINFDLYDNAEMLQCAVLIGDIEEAKKIAALIRKNFIYKNKIFSNIDIFGKRRNSNMLRWAILPYLYSLNLLETNEV